MDSALDPLDALGQRFRVFAEMEAKGSSPLYEHLSREIGADSELLAIAAGSRPGQQVPNLFFAAVHYLLLGGAASDLGRYYASVVDPATPPDAATYPLFHDFCLARRDELAPLLADGLVQTNEPKRSAALLLGLNEVVKTIPGHEMALVEVGASAGLNLVFDRYRYNFGDGRTAGSADARVVIESELRGDRRGPIDVPVPKARVGLDLNPILPGDEKGRAWLKALVWPENAVRRALQEAALATVAEARPDLIAGDAVDDLERVVGSLPDGLGICIFHSATMAHFPADARERFVETIERLASRRQLAWLSLEGPRLFPAPPGIETVGAYHVLGLTLFPWREREARSDRLLAAVAGHGGWVHWVDEEVPAPG